MNIQWHNSFINRYPLKTASSFNSPPSPTFSGWSLISIRRSTKSFLLMLFFRLCSIVCLIVLTKNSAIGSSPTIGLRRTAAQCGSLRTIWRAVTLSKRRRPIFLNSLSSSDKAYMLSPKTHTPITSVVNLAVSSRQSTGSPFASV